MGGAVPGKVLFFYPHLGLETILNWQKTFVLIWTFFFLKTGNNPKIGSVSPTNIPCLNDYPHNQQNYKSNENEKRQFSNSFMN